jgi:hypothetical protein
MKIQSQFQNFPWLRFTFKNSHKLMIFLLTFNHIHIFTYYYIHVDVKYFDTQNVVESYVVNCH